MYKWKVAVNVRFFAKTNPEPQKLLEDAGCLVIHKQKGSNILELLKDSDGVIAGLEPYTKEMFEACPKLKIISRYGVGYDAIDLEAARKAKVAVAITPGANSEAVADLAMALMLAAARRIPQLDWAVKSGQRGGIDLGGEVWKKTLGVIGTGSTGKALIRRASGFQMRILCTSPHPDTAFAAQYGASYVDRDTLFRESDFISLHAPLTPLTKNLINDRTLAAMKKTAILINTARGGIVDEEALTRALCNGTIAACALDVVENETTYESALYKHPNCIVLPHIGAATREASYNMSLASAQNLLEYLSTGKCNNLL